MFRSNCEPTIEEILRDPTVRALMKADRVDTIEFEAGLRGLARTIRREPAGLAVTARVLSDRRLPLAPIADGSAAAHQGLC